LRFYQDYRTYELNVIFYHFFYHDFLCNSFVFSLNKPLQEKIAIKYQINLEILDFCFELLGFFSGFLLKSVNSQHHFLVYDKITPNFLNINSTFFLDNSVKIVKKYDKNPYITLEKDQKLEMIIKMLINSLENLENSGIFLMKMTRNFTEYIGGICDIYGLSLFFLKSEKISIFSHQMRNFQRILSLNIGLFPTNTSNFKQNQMNFSIFDIKTLLDGFFEGNSDKNRGKSNENPLKGILRNIPINSLKNRCFTRIYEEFLCFILKEIRKESNFHQIIPHNSSLNILINSLVFLRYSFRNSPENPENPMKILRIHQDFKAFFFKDCKLISNFCIFLANSPSFELVSQHLFKYLNEGITDVFLSRFFSMVIELEMKDFEKNTISFTKFFDEFLLGKAPKTTRISFVIALLEKQLIGKNKEKREISMIIEENQAFYKKINDFCESFLKENGYKYQCFFLIIVILDKIACFSLEKAIFLSVFSNFIDKIIDFRFFLKLFEGISIEIASIKSIEISIKICKNAQNSIKNIKEKIGDFQQLKTLISAFQRHLQRIFIEICCFYAKNMEKALKKAGFKEIPDKILPMTFLEKIEKNKVLAICQDIINLEFSFEKQLLSSNFLMEMSEFMLDFTDYEENNTLNNIVILIKNSSIS